MKATRQMTINDLRNTIICGDCLEVLKTLPDKSVNCCITSPPYWALRDYGCDGQVGLEDTPDEYIKSMVAIFREVRRVLCDDGTMWLNLGDSYIANNKATGKFKNKDLCGIPWRVAFALHEDGWYLRQDIIWHKPNPMPESVTDRCTKAHEYIFLLTKSARYFYDNEAIMEEAAYDGRKSTVMKPSGKYISGKFLPDKAVNSFHSRGHERWPNKDVDGKRMRNKRSVWTVTAKPLSDAHFAPFPPDLIEPCVIAGCPEGGIILDPFMGAGTSGLVAMKWGRKYIGIELNPAYIAIANRRIQDEKDKIALFPEAE